MTKQLIILVVAHAFSLLVCSLAHERLDFLYSISLYFPLLAPLILGPIIIGFFLPTRFVRQASIALIGILPAEAVYLISDHFGTPPRIVQIEYSAMWKIIYEGAFGVTLMLEAIGFWLAIKILLELHKQLPPRNASNQ